MNSLKRTIEKGEVVVIKAKLMRPEFQDLEERLFVVEGGFGMLNETAGTAIFGKHLKDAEEARWEGYDIDPDETAEYQRTHVSNVYAV